MVIWIPIIILPAISWLSRTQISRRWWFCLYVKVTRELRGRFCHLASISSLNINGRLDIHCFHWNLKGCRGRLIASQSRNVRLSGWFRTGFRCSWPIIKNINSAKTKKRTILLVVIESGLQQVWQGFDRDYSNVPQRAPERVGLFSDVFKTKLSRWWWGYYRGTSGK